MPKSFFENIFPFFMQWTRFFPKTPLTIMQWTRFFHDNWLLKIENGHF